MTEYIYICPKCGMTYENKTPNGTICSGCGVETINSGFSSVDWYSLIKKDERVRIVNRIKASAMSNNNDSETNNANKSDLSRLLPEIADHSCRYCGKTIMREAVICPHCGCATGRADPDDVPSTGLNVLSFFVPIIGLILYCVFYTRTPKKAAGVGKAALISVAVRFVFWLVFRSAGISSLLWAL